MKRLTFLLASILCSVAVTALAQTSPAKTSTNNKSTAASPSKTASSITDDDLRKYAITQDSIKGMQQTLLQIIAENVQQNNVMPVSRYNELFKIEKDQTKLAAANATPEEIAFLKEISDLKELNTQRINTTYQALAKEYVGLKTFNLIRKSLDTDPALKNRYQTISQKVESSDNTQKLPADSKGK